MPVTKEQRAEQTRVAKAAMEYFTQQGYVMRRRSLLGGQQYIEVRVKDWDAVRGGRAKGLPHQDRLNALKIIYGNEYAEKWRDNPTAGNVDSTHITMTCTQWKRFLWMPA